jgi:hypothetical protein
VPDADQPFGFKLSKPAERALLGAGYDTPAKLFAATDEEMLALHGVGKKGMRLIREEQARQARS